MRWLQSALFSVFIVLLGGGDLQAAELNFASNRLPINLGPYVDHYEDLDAELTIEELLRSSIPWQRSQQNVPTLGISRSAHWFHLIISESNATGEPFVLALNAPVLDQVDFYFVEDGEVIRSTTAGDAIPNSELDYLYRFPVIPFEINTDSASMEIYIRAKSSAGVELPLQLTTIEQLPTEQLGENAFLVALLTLFLTCFAVCSIFCYFFRSTPFFAYTLFFGSTMVFFLSQTGIGKLWLWGEYSSANTRISYVAAAGLIASLCLVGQSLHLAHRYQDSINIVLRFITWAMPVVALYFLLIPFEYIAYESVVPFMILGLLVTTSVLIISGMSAAQGSRAAFFLFLSWAMLILAYIPLLAYKTSIIERSAGIPLISSGFAIVSAILLILSVAEYVRSKNEEFLNARTATKAKGDFLKNVSREFLTPVHLVLANSKRLMAAQSNSLDEGTRQHMTTVIKQSDHLHNLINDLLEMAELEADSFEPEFEFIEISHFLNEVKDMIAPSAMEKGLEINTQFAAANLLVQTDKSRLQHALINILTNAIKYTETGSIKIGYKAAYFRRRLGIEIFIEDTGRGMSKEFQQRLFQEFAREEELSEKDPQGTGLGLVIVKRMIEKLGGEITFESTKNQGSQFFIRLPLRVAQD